MFLKADKVIYEFGPDLEAHYYVKAGDEFVVETNDCFYQQLLSEGGCLANLDMGRVNPATGPIFVEGAEVGDLLKVEILEIQLADRGVASVFPGMGFLADKNTEEKSFILPVEEEKVDLFGVRLPVEPMIGVIGVATKKDYLATDTPGAHGGNLDTKDIGPGSTIYFPVNQEGALLALGDCHAIMGDGEVGVTGLEIAAKVRLRLDVIKNKELPWPLLETEDSLMLLVSAPDIESALKLGLEETILLLKKSLGLSWNEATVLSSLALDARISQLVNPQKTVRYPIKKEILSMEKILKSL